MKKQFIMISAGMIVAGCATTDQLADLNARIQVFEKESARVAELEKRLSRIEGDLYEPEKKQPPKVIDGQKQVLSQSGQKIHNDALDIPSFCGFVFDKTAKELGGVRSVTLEKPIRLFTMVRLSYTSYSHRLWEVRLNAKIDKAQSFDSYKDEFDKLLQIVNEKYGVTMSGDRNRLGSRFKNENVEIFTWKNGDEFELVVRNWAVSKRDAQRQKDEAKKFSIPNGKDADRL